MRNTDPYSTQNNSSLDSIDIILLGGCRVGKTSLAHKLTSNNISHSHHPTIAIQFHSTMINTKNHDYHIRLWDTSGQNKYRKIGLQYLSKVHAAIVVFDLTNYETYHQAKQWVNEIHQSASSIPIGIFGNKKDLCLSKVKEVQQLREIKKDEVKKYVDENAIIYNQGCGIADDEFKKIIQVLIEKFFITNQLILQGEESAKSCCC